jgi:uncharacterized SAM-binding protein YcdF (DUF218 family)
MPELITQILLLIGIFFLIRFVLWNLVPRVYLTWLGLLVLLFILASVFLDPDNRTAGILWGILSFPLRPLGLSLLLLGYALSRVSSVFYGGKPVAKATLGVPQVMSAFLILLITSLPLTAYLLTAQTEQRTALEISQQPAGSVQAIVVLGDGTLPTDPAYRVRTQLSNTVNGLSVSLESRLNYAAQLYAEQAAQGNAPLIVVSAGPQAILARPGVTSADAINAYLGRLGIPAEQIRVDNEGFDPRSSAIAVRRILLGPGAVEECAIYAVCDGDVRRLPSGSPQANTVIPVILVTPALTLRRAVSTFDRLAFDVTARPTDFYVFQLQGGLRLAAITDLIPNAEALAITTRVIDEYLAWLYYFMRGWLQDPLNV